MLCEWGKNRRTLSGIKKVLGKVTNAMDTPAAICRVCKQKDDSDIEAVIWCTVCEERLCKGCNEVHKFSRSGNNHEVLTIKDYQKLPPFISSLKQRCEKHNELYQLYCPAHQEPCCCECASIGHKTCHGFQSMEYLIRNRSTTVLLDLECSVNELITNIQKVLGHRTEALKTMNENVKEINEQIINARKKINETLDSMEREIFHHLSIIHTKNEEKIVEVISVLQQKKCELDNVQKNVEELKEFASEQQIVLGSRILNAKLEKEERNFRQLFDNEKILRQKDSHFKFKPGLILDNGNFVGELEVEFIPCEIPFKKNESFGSEISLDILQDIEAIHLRTSTQFKLFDGIATRNIAGCTFLENGQILFPDWSENNELLFFDEQGKRKRSIVLDKKAFDVAYIGHHCIALTFPDSKQFSVLDLKSKTEEYNVSFENRCWGITNTDNNLFVREYSVGIHCLDMQGELVKILPVSGYITHISSYNNKLYYTQHTPDVVHCCDIDGNEIWQLAIEGQPKGITIGKFGFVFVVLEKECKLLVISPDGTRYKEILNSENGLHEPHAVAYDMHRNKLVLVKDKTGLAELYDILY